MMAGSRAWPAICAPEAAVAHAGLYPERAEEYGPGLAPLLAAGRALSAMDYARAHEARLRFRGELAGVFEDKDADAEPATVTLGDMNIGPLTMSNGLTRLQTRFWGDEAGYEAVAKRKNEALEAEDAADLGLITFAPDDIDWDEEIRIATEERSSFSPDALTGLEANYRFAGPETMETKIFGRLTAWQNWIFNRPNASGPDGALRRFGTGQRAVFDRKRV